MWWFMVKYLQRCHNAPALGITWIIFFLTDRLCLFALVATVCQQREQMCSACSCALAPLKGLKWSASTLGLWGVLHDCARVFLSQFFGAIVDYSNNLIRCTLLFLFCSRGCILHIQVCMLGRRSRTTASLPLTSHSRRRSR